MAEYGGVENDHPNLIPYGAALGAVGKKGTHSMNKFTPISSSSAAPVSPLSPSPPPALSCVLFKKPPSSDDDVPSYLLYAEGKRLCPINANTALVEVFIEDWDQVDDNGGEDEIDTTVTTEGSFLSNAFEIVDSSGNTHLLRAPNTDNHCMWLEAIKNAIGECIEAEIKSSAATSGVLTKEMVAKGRAKAEGAGLSDLVSTLEGLEEVRTQGRAVLFLSPRFKRLSRLILTYISPHIVASLPVRKKYFNAVYLHTAQGPRHALSNIVIASDGRRQSCGWGGIMGEMARQLERV